jgi:acyl carrier protein
MNVNGEIQTLDPADAAVRQLLMDLLVRKLVEGGIPVTGIDEKTALIDLGVIDSQGLLDLILEVEDRSGLIFDPLRIDLEGVVTLERIAAAFSGEPLSPF